MKEHIRNSQERIKAINTSQRSVGSSGYRPTNLSKLEKSLNLDLPDVEESSEEIQATENDVEPPQIVMQKTYTVEQLMGHELDKKIS